MRALGTCAALAIGMLLAGQARADDCIVDSHKPEPTESETEHWYDCDNDESYCEVRTKRHYLPPDKPIALTLAYETAWMSQSAPRLLARADVVPRLTAALGLDIAARGRWALALEAEYGVDGQSASLFDGAVSTAITVHTISVSYLIRYMLCDCSNPPWEIYMRRSTAIELADISVRDARDSQTREDMDTNFPQGIGLGIVWRETGLGAELGYRITTGDVNLEEGPFGHRPRMDRDGPYGRISLTVRLP